jgi:mycofactocin precursor
MDKRATSTAPATVPATETPATAADDAVPGDDELVEGDLLVEDVSIDGMCGVY